MSQTAREYLMHRFRGDAEALTERVAAFQRGSKMPGPDASTSQRMADACAAVVALLEGIAPHDDAAAELAAITSLVPLLESKARDASSLPPVRAVYAGAATRIREVQQAEASAAASATVSDDEELDALDDDADDAVEDLDDDIDDDDLAEDEIA